jgi:chaperonin GroEL (HSP60 family)
MFAESLEVIPRTLAENSGLDPIDILTELKARHDKNETKIGLDLTKSSSSPMGGEICNTFEKGIIEPLEIKIQAIKSASEVSMMILRIDDVIASGKGTAGPQMPPGGMPQY